MPWTKQGNLRGPAGPKGLNHRGVWSSTATYAVDDAATQDGSTWRALRANTNVAPVEGLDWTLLAGKGQTGPKGLNHRGAWSSTATYASDDAVSHNGSSWRALRANINVVPVEGLDWTILAAQGTLVDGSVTAAKMAAANRAIEIVTSTTRPASPVEGQHIYETDTDATLKNTGTPAAPVWSALGGGAVTQATEAALGGGEIATQLETNAGTDDLRIVTPLKLANRIAVGSFRAFQGVAQLDIASATWTKVLFNTEDWDASAWFDPAASRYTPQKAGIYSITACVGISPTVDAKFFTVAVYKNGLEYARMGQSHTGSVVAMLVTGAAEIVLNGTTDFIEVFCQHNFAVNTSDLLADPKFTFINGHYVGAAA